jgi:hypothetical protein
MSEDRGSKFEDRPALDVAIDAAVREMVGIEPRADLRARVLRRIEGSDVASAFRRKDHRRKLLLTAVPLAAAAAVILAVLLPSRTTQPQPASPILAIAEPPRVQCSTAAVTRACGAARGGRYTSRCRGCAGSRRRGSLVRAVRGDDRDRTAAVDHADRDDTDCSTSHRAGRHQHPSVESDRRSAGRTVESARRAEMRSLCRRELS